MSEGTLTDPRHTRILSLNARSLLHKIDDLRGLYTYHHFAAIVVTETWLSPEVLDGDVDISGYNIIRKDRNRHGGGVAIYILNSLPFSPLHLTHVGLELLAVECLLNSRLLTIVGFYPQLQCRSYYQIT